MKIARISLGLAAVVISSVGAFAFRSHSAKFIKGTLYTVGKANHVDCSRAITTNFCPVTAYTLHGTKLPKNTAGSYATAE